MNDKNGGVEMDKETKQMLELILKKLDGVEKRQDEMYVMQRGFEENIKQLLNK